MKNHKLMHIKASDDLVGLWIFHGCDLVAWISPDKIAMNLPLTNIELINNPAVRHICLQSVTVQFFSMSFRIQQITGIWEQWKERDNYSLNASLLQSTVAKPIQIYVSLQLCVQNWTTKWHFPLNFGTVAYPGLLLKGLSFSCSRMEISKLPNHADLLVLCIIMPK